MLETLADLLVGRPALSKRPALLFGEQTYTYAELETQSNQVANALIAQNIQSSDFVCQAVASRPELIVNLFGILKSGARYAPLNPSLTERELSEQLTDSQPVVLIAEDEVAEKLRSAPASPRGLRVWRVGEWAAECRRMPDKRPSRELDPEGPALLFYTSGTSGRSKGVQITHEQVLINARQVLERTGAGPEDRLLVVMPIFHANGFCNQVVLPLLAGASIVLRPRFVRDEFWREVARYRPTYFTAVPTIMSRLLEGPELPPAAERSSLRFIRTGAAPLSLELQRRFESRFELPVISSYGLTEATCTVTMNPATWEGRRLGSVGKVLDGLEVVVLGEDNSVRPAKEVGEVAVRGPTVMLGYRGLPEATAEAIKDKWLLTGDLGYLNDDGYLFLTDRKKDIIIRGGENISSREIEEVLTAHPLVAEAAVVGAPDTQFGEQVVAFVVLRDRAGSLKGVEAELLAHCRTRLARFKVPTRFEELNDLPKNAIGKVLKQSLTEGLTGCRQ